jgi:phosphopantothenoylcysteine synthetase/decarboxylase
MNVLVTAGNTLVPIDRVRCLTNIFTGRTGAGIALHAHERGHAVTLLTSHPNTVRELEPTPPAQGERWDLYTYDTFEYLQNTMQNLLRLRYDAVIHSAAVSDYRAAGIYAPAPRTVFDPEEGEWHSDPTDLPKLLDRAAGKVKSDEHELWLRLVRTPKLVDMIRRDWGFGGVLVKFKLEVGISDEQLLEIAERSRQHSQADLMVANTLEGAKDWAFVGPVAGAYQRTPRPDLAPRLLDEVERLHRERANG